MNHGSPVFSFDTYRSGQAPHPAPGPLEDLHSRVQSTLVCVPDGPSPAGTEDWIVAVTGLLVQVTIVQVVVNPSGGVRSVKCGPRPWLGKIFCDFRTSIIHRLVLRFLTDPVDQVSLPTGAWCGWSQRERTPETIRSRSEFGSSRLRVRTKEDGTVLPRRVVSEVDP